MKQLNSSFFWAVFGDWSSSCRMWYNVYKSKTISLGWLCVSRTVGALRRSRSTPGDPRQTIFPLSRTGFAPSSCLPASCCQIFVVAASLWLTRLIFKSNSNLSTSFKVGLIFCRTKCTIHKENGRLEELSPWAFHCIMNLRFWRIDWIVILHLLFTEYCSSSALQ